MGLTHEQLARATENYRRFSLGQQPLVVDPILAQPFPAPIPAGVAVMPGAASLQSAPVPMPVEVQAPLPADVVEPESHAIAPDPVVAVGEPAPVSAPTLPTTQITPEMLRHPQTGLVGAMNEATAGTERLVQAQDEAGAAELGALDQRRQMAQANAAEAERAGVDGQKALDAGNAQAGEAIDKWRKFTDAANNTQIMYDRRTTGQKIMGTIALALGGIGDAMAAAGGREQHAQDKIQQGIQDAIDRDVMQQKEAVEDKRRAAAGALTEYGYAKELLGNTKEALQFARNIRADKYAAQMEEQAAITDSAKLRGALKIGAERLRAATNASQQQIFSEFALQDKRTAAAFAEAQARGAQVSPELYYRMGQDSMNRENAAAARQIPGLEPTRDLTQVTDQQYKEAYESTKLYDQLESNLNRMKGVATQDYSLLNGNPIDQYKKLATAQDAYKLLKEASTAMVTQGVGSGVPGAQEALRVQAGLPDPSAFAGMSPIDRAAVFDQAIDTFRELKRVAIESTGAYRLPGQAQKPPPGPVTTKAPARRSEQRIKNAVQGPGKSAAAPAGPAVGLPKSGDEW